jgi:hypothetical protein
MPHFVLDMASLPDELYTPDVPTEKWIDRVQKQPEKFPSGSLGALSPCPPKAELERLIGIPLYLMLNWLPFLLPIISVTLGGWKGLVILVVVLAALSLKPVTGVLHTVLSKLPLALGVPPAQISGQYAYTERNTQKYLSTRLVWGEAFDRVRNGNKPVIFAIIPHGVAPLGITAYPAFSRLGGGALCRWTAAPVVMKLPLVGPMLRSMGYVEAKGKAISGALQKGSSVGIVLDGIAGMFQQATHAECGYVLQRKAIAAIALKAGVSIVPVYGFGHTSLWSVVTDPFGVLEKLSIALKVSICPFYGRWGLPLGPPRRTPLLVAFGEPIEVGAPNASPSKEEVASVHAKLVEGFTTTFEEHKHEYGWGDRRLRLV